MEDEWIEQGYYSSPIHLPGNEWVKVDPQSSLFIPIPHSSAICPAICSAMDATNLKFWFISRLIKLFEQGSVCFSLSDPHPYLGENH